MTLEKTGGTWRWLGFAVEIIHLLVSGKSSNFTHKFQVRAMLFKFTKSRGKDESRDLVLEAMLYLRFIAVI